MKRLIVLLVAALLLFSAFTATRPDPGIAGTDPGITGIIEPPDMVNKVIAIKDNDSASVVPVNGRFSLTLKPGNWMLIVKALNPYKDNVQPVLVIEGGPTDVGVIKLERQ